ncbi:MAG: DUF2062 domain-containing protein [Spirochaetales bacterium]|nr:DUF2062 domain-containing protein [Spirochaetales bacterium]
MWQKIKASVDTHLIKPFRESQAPVREICLGSSVGFFWGLTPLVGAQMALVFGNWVLFRMLRLRFSLPIGLALVWLTNPVTMPLFYYTFYITGVFFFRTLGFETELISRAVFTRQIEVASAMDTIDGLMHWIRFMIVDLGWPMLIGSFVFGAPFTIGSYPVTKILVNRYRTAKARAMGLSLAEWETRYVHAEKMEDLVASPGHQIEEPVAQIHTALVPERKSRRRRLRKTTAGRRSSRR